MDNCHLLSAHKKHFQKVGSNAQTSVTGRILGIHQNMGHDPDTAYIRFSLQLWSGLGSSQIDVKLF